MGHHNLPRVDVEILGSVWGVDSRNFNENSIWGFLSYISFSVDLFPHFVVDAKSPLRRLRSLEELPGLSENL